MVTRFICFILHLFSSLIKLVNFHRLNSNFSPTAMINITGLTTLSSFRRYTNQMAKVVVIDNEFILMLHLLHSKRPPAVVKKPHLHDPCRMSKSGMFWSPVIESLRRSASFALGCMPVPQSLDRTHGLLNLCGNGSLGQISLFTIRQFASPRGTTGQFDGIHRCGEQNLGSPRRTVKWDIVSDKWPEVPRKGSEIFRKDTIWNEEWQHINQIDSTRDATRCHVGRSEYALQ